MEAILDEVQYQRILRYKPENVKTKETACVLLNCNIRPNVAIRYFKSHHHKESCNDSIKDHLIYFKHICSHHNIQPTEILEDLLFDETANDKYLIANTISPNNIHSFIERTDEISKFIIISDYCRRYDVPMESKMSLYEKYIAPYIHIDHHILRDISLNASREDVQKWPDFPWKPSYMASSPYAEVQVTNNKLYINGVVVEHNEEYDYCIRMLTKNKHFVKIMQYVLDYPEIPWSWDIPYNSNVTYDDLIKHKDLLKPNSQILIYKYSKRNPVITPGKFKTLLSQGNTAFPLNHMQVSNIKRIYIHIKYQKKYTKLPKNYSELNEVDIISHNLFYMLNNSLTYKNAMNYLSEDVLSNKSIGQHLIINRSFIEVLPDDPDVILYIRRQLMIKRIQRQWRDSISNPQYRICRNRLQREYNNLNVS